MDKIYTDLYNAAKEARKFSYSPYSCFSVGAALLCDDGEIFTGANIENSSYSLTNCAERTAIFKAVSQGKTKFRAIAIAGGKDDNISEPCYPCGACRQVMAEFCEGNFKIILSNKVVSLSELLPYTFELKEK